MMKAALLPDRGVVKVVGDDAGKFLNGLDHRRHRHGGAGTCALCRAADAAGQDHRRLHRRGGAPEDGGGFFLDVPRALAPTLVQRLNFYRLRAKVIVEDLSEVLGVLAAWGGNAQTPVGLSLRRSAAAGTGPALHAAAASRRAGHCRISAPRRSTPRTTTHTASRSACRAARLDFGYGDAFPHEADMDQLHGVDFDKGCFVGQEVVSRMAHRGTARTRVVPVALSTARHPGAGTPVTAGDKSVGTLGSTANGQGLAMLRLDRAADALAAGAPLVADGVALRLVKPSWARFAFPGEARPRNSTCRINRIRIKLKYDRSGSHRRSAREP